MTRYLRRLKPAAADRLRGTAFSYPEVGATADPELPAGYHHLEHRALLGTGEEVFVRASTELLRWDMQLRTGLGVESSSRLVEAGAVAVVRIGLGPFGVRAPVRVIELTDEPRVRGFTYGTLPGHPECGEERFLVEWDAEDRVHLVLRAFSRPGTTLARVLGPLGGVVQRYVTRRYGRALT